MDRKRWRKARQGWKVSTNRNGRRGKDTRPIIGWKVSTERNGRRWIGQKVQNRMDGVDWNQRLGR